MTRLNKKPQLELPLVTSNGSEQLEISFNELASLQARLASEGRFIRTLEVRQGGYRATIQKRPQQTNDPDKFSRPDFRCAQH